MYERKTISLQLKPKPYFMKKIATLFAVLLFTIAVWAQRVEIDGLYYSLDSETKTASVSYHINKGYIGDIVIPPYVVYNAEQYTVTELSAWSFKGNQGITSISIPNTIVENIDEYTFENCTSLKSVYWNACNYKGDSPFYAIRNNITSFTFGNDIKVIGSVCNGMNNLTQVTIPNGVTDIGNNAFSACGLKSVTLPNSIRTIGISAFSSCDSLSSIKLSDNLTEIKERAFDNCISLTSIDLPLSLTTLGDFVFSHCAGITSITIPINVTCAGYEVFWRCTSLTSVTWNAKNCEVRLNGTFPDVSKNITSFTFGDSVQSIPSILCQYMEKLTSIKIPQSVKEIGVSAFANCKALESVEIGAGVKSIGRDAFNWCSKLKKVNYLGTDSQWANINFNDYKSTPTYYSKSLYINNNLLVDAEISGIDSIKQYSFYNCRNLKSVKIGKGVKVIGLRSFMDCDSLSIINMNQGLIKIDDDAFHNCEKLSSVEIPHSVIEIGEEAFGYCDGLRSLTIGSGVELIGDRAFYQAHLRTVTLYPTKLLDIPYDFYAVDLYVPCALLNDYQLHDTYKECKSIQCIEADKVDNIDNVDVQLLENQRALLSWPAVESAHSYTLELSTNDGLSSTFIFDAEGLLQTASFANRSATQGFQFILYSLELASVYNYTMVALDKNGKTLQTSKGSFVTNSDVEDTPTSLIEKQVDAKILLSKGQIQVVGTDFRIYNMIGVDVTANNGNLIPGIYLVSINSNIDKVMVQ